MIVLLFITTALAIATPRLTVKKQRELYPNWAAKNSFPTPMPIIPTPKYCTKHPQNCQQEMKSAERYWYDNVLNDVIKSTGANAHLELPPKSNSVDHQVWFKYWRRFVDVLRVNEYPQPPKRQERNEWSTYWKGVVKYGQYWPQHPPPANYQHMKGYKAWVDEFKPCTGAGCGIGMEAKHAKHGAKRFLKKIKKGIKKALHLGSHANKANKANQQEGMRHGEEHFAHQGQSQTHPPYPNQPQGYNQLGPRGSAPPSSYEYNKQGRPSNLPYGQTSIDINRQTQGSFNRSGSSSHPSYSMDVNRQTTFSNQPYGYNQQGPHGGQANFNTQADFYKRPSSSPQRSFDVSGQVSFDVTRQSPYQQQQQHQRDLSRQSSYSSQGSYGHPYDRPFDPFDTISRGSHGGHPQSHGYGEDPFASINRQFGQQSCSGSSDRYYSGSGSQGRSSFTPPPDTVFHGHHSQFGPVYRSTTDYSQQQQQQQQHGTTSKLRYYIERNGALTEVSADIFHELRCGSSQMTCCAPHCDESAYKHHGHQGANISGSSQQQRQSQYGGQSSGSTPGYRSGVWGSTHTGSTGTSSTSSRGSSGKKDTSSEGGIWSSLTNFWNQPADWHERERRWKHGGKSGHTTSQRSHAQGQGHYGQGQYGQSQSNQQYGQQPTRQASYERSVTYGSQNQPTSSGYGQASWGSTSQQQQQPSGQGSWNIATSGQPAQRNVSVERSVSYSGSSSQAPPPSSFSYNQQHQQQGGMIGGAGSGQQQQAPPSSFSYNQQH